MQPFRSPDIENACQTMYGFLGGDPALNASGTANLRASLVHRTQRLLGELRGVGKLIATGNGTVSCGGALLSW